MVIVIGLRSLVLWVLFYFHSENPFSNFTGIKEGRKEYRKKERKKARRSR
jgi:hypothetical protein